MFRRYRLLSIAVVLMIAAGTAAVASASADEPAQMCTRYQSVAVKNGRYIVMNNVWGATTAQCVEVSADGAFRVVETSHRNVDTAAAFPSIYAGCHWGHCTRGTNLPLQVERIRSLRSNWRTVTGAPGMWNAAYDLWFHTTAEVDRSPDGAELMIWLDKAGGANPSGLVVARNVRLAGAVWDIWYASSAWNYVAYVRTTRTSSVENLDLKAFVFDAVGRGYVDRSWYLSGVEAGFEVYRDGAGLTSESFSVKASEGLPSRPTGAPSTPFGPAIADSSSADPAGSGLAEPGPSQTPKQPPACSLRWSANAWNTGLVTEVVVTNHGPPLRGWVVSWEFDADERVDNDWGAEITQSGQRVVAANAPYNGYLGTNGSATFGFQAQHGGRVYRPATVRLNGQPCAVS